MLHHENKENQTNYPLSNQSLNQQSFSSQNNLCHEEDLGFDPLCESLNALQDLMLTENSLNGRNGHTNSINYLSSRPVNTNTLNHNVNSSSNSNQLEYYHKQQFKPDLSQTFQNPSLESLLALQQNQLLTNSLAAPTSLNTLLQLNHKPNGIVPPPGFANTKLSSSSTSSSNSTSTNSSASSSVNNSASSTPSVNNFVQQNKAFLNGSNGNLHALKSIFPNANISFGNNFAHSNQSSHTNVYKNLTNLNSNNCWPDDPAIISLTDQISASNNSNSTISGLSDFSSNLNRSLSPAVGINGSHSSVKSSFYDNFSLLQNSYHPYQNYENMAKLQQLHQFMIQQQMNNNALDQAQQQHQFQMIKSLQSKNFSLILAVNFGSVVKI